MEEQKEKSHKLLIILIIILVFLLGVAGSIGVWWWQQQEAQKQKSNSDKQIQELQQQINELKSSAKDKSEEAAEMGFIDGSITYPSEVIPDDLVVYAENIDTGEVYETADRINSDVYAISHIGYKIEVPAGKYYVYAKLTSDPAKKAYYNKFITCGMSVECADTTKIKVTVTTGETTDNITVGDWWNL